MEIEKLFNTISVAGGITGGILTYWLGGFDLLLKTLLFLTVADYVTGIMKAVYTCTLSSSIGFKGLLKKITVFIVIAVANVIGDLMGDAFALREVVAMFYICNEALSLLENAAVFVPIPDKLKNVLLQLRESNETGEDDEQNRKPD